MEKGDKEGKQEEGVVYKVKCKDCEKNIYWRDKVQDEEKDRSAHKCTVWKDDK